MCPSVQFNSETSNSFAESLELGQGVLPRCRFMSLVHPDSQECPIQILCGNLQWRETFNSLGIKRAFGLLQIVKMTRSMMHDSRCLVRKQFPCFSFDGSEFNNTSSITVIPVAHSSTLLHDTFSWSTDAKSKLKFGVVFVTVEQQVCCVSSSDR